MISFKHWEKELSIIIEFHQCFEKKSIVQISFLILYNAYLAKKGGNVMVEIQQRTMNCATLWSHWFLEIICSRVVGKMSSKFSRDHQRGKVFYKTDVKCTVNDFLTNGTWKAKILVPFLQVGQNWRNCTTLVAETKPQLVFQCRLITF